MAKIKLVISAESAQAVAALKQVAAAAAHTGGSVRKAGEGSGDGFRELTHSLADATIAAAGLMTALSKIKDAIIAILRPGFEFSKTMETTKLGIAGILMSMTNLNGKTLTLQQALSVASDLIRQMQDYSTKIGLPMDAMTEGFQAMLGPGLSAKMQLEEIVQIAGTGMKAVKAFGLENRQIAQEMRDLLSGNISMDSTLAKSLNITGGDIQRAKQSADGLFKYLMEKLKGMQEIAKAYPDTLTGGLEKIKNVFTIGSADAGKKFYDGIKQKVNELFNAIADVNEETGKMTLKPEVKQAIADLSDSVFEILDSCIKIGIALGPTFLDVLKVITSMLRFVAENARAVGIAFAAWLTIGKVRGYLIGIKAELIATTGAATALEVAMVGVKVAIRSAMISTGVGILAAALGYAADQALRLYENMDKAGKARRDYFKEKAAINSPMPQQLEGKLQKPVFAINPDVNMGIKAEALDKMEKFIAAVNYLYPDKAVTVTSGYRQWGGHVSGTKADVAIQGMEDPYFRRVLIKLAEEFGIAVLDEVDNPASDTPEARANWGPHLDLDMKGGGGTKPGDISTNSDVTKDPWDAVEANNKRAVAAMEKDTTEYLTKLGDKLQELEAKHTSNLISESDYYEKKKKIEFEQAQATVDLLEQKVVAQKDLIEKAGKYKTPAEIMDMGNVITNLEKELIPARSQLNELANDIKNLGLASDEVNEAKIQAMMAALREFESSNRYYAEHPGGAKGAYQFMPGTWADKASLAGLSSDAPMTKENQDAVARAWIIDILKKNNGRMSAIAEAWLGGDSRIGLPDAELATIRDSNNTSILDYRNKVMEIFERNLAKMPNLAGNFSKLSPDFAKYLQEQEDRMLEELKIHADRLEAEGKPVEAQLIRSEVEYRKLLQQLSANKQTGAIDDVKRIQEIKNARVEADKLFSDIDIAKAKFANDVADLAKQALSPEEYTKRLAELTTQLDTVTAEKLKRLTELNNTVLVDPAYAEKIRQSTGETLKVGSDSLYAFIDRQKNILDISLADLDQQYDVGIMDSIEYERRKIALQKEYADIILKYVIPALEEMAKLEGQDAINKVNDLKTSVQGLKKEIDPLQREFRYAAKNSLEEFFTTGIQECKNFGDAFRNLIASMLTEMTKINAKRMAEMMSNSMGDWFFGIFGDGKSSKKTKAEGNADGGPIIGPGTGTSDSILSWLSNGEFVVKAASVKKFGVNFFHALNSGFLPRISLPAFATGGLVRDNTAGPHDLAASLVSNTSVPLKIVNVTDPNEVGRYLQSRSGEKVMVNWIKNNAGTVRQILKIKG